MKTSDVQDKRDGFYDQANIQRQLGRLVEDMIASERITIITGAGVSVASGIAPFRKSPDAIWEKEVTIKGTLSHFISHPAEAWSWYADRFSKLTEKKPNETHYSLVELETWCRDRDIELTLITQNVDRLHHKAGHQNLIEIHGRSDLARCISQGCEFASPRGYIRREDLSFESFYEQSLPENLPRCPSCQSMIRPHVLWFDETYDSHELYRFQEAVEAMESADLIIAIGTSFSVGITELALQCAEYNGATIWGLDLAEDDQVPVDEWLLGRAENLSRQLINVLKGRS